MGRFGIRASFKLTGGAMRRGRRVCNGGIMMFSGGPSFIGEFFNRFAGAKVFLVVLSLFCFFITLDCRDGATCFKFLMVNVIVTGTFISTFRLFSYRGALASVGRAAGPSIEILHSNIMGIVGSIRLIPNSVVLLRRNSCIYTSTQLVRAIRFHYGRIALDDRRIPISGGTSIVLRSVIPLRGHAGVIFASAATIRNATGTIIVTANVGARDKGATAVGRRVNRGGLPVRGRLGLVSGFFGVVVLYIYILIFIIAVLRGFGAPRPFTDVALATLLGTTTLTFTTVPRKLGTVSAVIVTANVGHVFSRGVVFGSDGSLRVLNGAGIVYTSGANVFAQGRVILRTVCSKGGAVGLGDKCVSSATTTILGLTTTYGALRGSAARGTVTSTYGRCGLGNSIRVGALFPGVSIVPFSSLHGSVAMVAVVGRRPITVIGNTPRVIIPGYISYSVRKVLGIGRRLTTSKLHGITVTVGHLSIVPTVPGSRRMRHSLAFINVLKLGRPVHRRVCGSVGAYGSTGVGIMVLANSGLRATISLTRGVNLLGSRDRTVDNIRVSRVASRRLDGGVGGCYMFTHVSPSRGTEVIGT